MIRQLLGSALFVLGPSACGDAPPPATAPVASADKATATPEPELESKPAEPETPGEPAPEPMEEDPNATKSVVVIDLEGQPPEGAKVRGEFAGALSWTDKYGKHAVVFGIKTHEGEASTTSMLVADFQSWEGDAWVSQREFKERVDKCEFDTSLEPFVGDWSVTDLDHNGIAEVTFAWKAGCRSDVSPVTHKVLLVGFDAEARVAKYVLRGTGGIEIAGALDPASSANPRSAYLMCIFIVCWSP